MFLATLCVVPVWNAWSLMQDPNYVFWAGTNVPVWMILVCLGVLLLYVGTVMAFFGYSQPQAQTEQTIMMIANVFITLLGLSLMLVSLPLSRQAVATYNNLMRRCDYSPQTHRVYEYSQVLQNIRRTPGCVDKYSVEECQGYEDAPPFTNFLKTLENDLKCSGFCYVPSATKAPANAPRPAPAGALTQLIRKWHKPKPTAHQDHVTALGMLQADEASSGRAQHEAGEPADIQPTVSRYPPTLFSDANYQASCEGMAARDMRNFAGDVGYQTFYQGIYLVLIAIATGMLKLVGFCAQRKDR